ncbi:MAG: hypothetical protein U0790_13990 [Isosphaeraceae bacterium]
MPPRIQGRTRRLAASMVLAAGLVALVGCDPRPFFYFLQPFEPTIPAPGPSLKGKKVVVLSHATAGSQGEFPSLERDLNREFVAQLRKKGKKITVVEPDKVASWVEAHPKWTDPTEAARDHEADVAIFLEIEQFQLQAPGDLNVLQGTAKVHIQAFELDFPKNSKGKPIKEKPKESRPIYDDYQETTFPIRGPIPVDSGVGRAAFKNKLVQVVASEVSWHFVEHSQDEMIQDVRFNQR